MQARVVHCAIQRAVNCVAFNVICGSNLLVQTSIFTPSVRNWLLHFRDLEYRFTITRPAHAHKQTQHPEHPRTTVASKACQTSDRRHFENNTRREAIAVEDSPVVKHRWWSSSRGLREQKRGGCGAIRSKGHVANAGQTARDRQSRSSCERRIFFFRGRLLGRACRRCGKRESAAQQR